MKKRRILSLLLAIAMVATMVPTAVFAGTTLINEDYKVNVEISKDAEQFEGRDALTIAFQAKTLNGKKLATVQGIALRYDADLFDLYYIGTDDVDDPSHIFTGLKEKLAQYYGITVGNAKWSIGTTAACQINSDGYMLLQPVLPNAGVTTNDIFKTLASFRLVLKEGTSINAIPASAIRLITFAESKTLNQVQIAALYDGISPEGFSYGRSYQGAATNNDELTKPTFTYVGYQPMLDTPAVALTADAVNGGLTAAITDTVNELDLVKGYQVQLYDAAGTTAVGSPVSVTKDEATVSIPLSDAVTAGTTYTAKIMAIAEMTVPQVFVDSAYSAACAGVAAAYAPLNTVAGWPATVTGQQVGMALTAVDLNQMVTGGSGAYTFAVTAGTLPAGITLTSGVLSGTFATATVADNTVTVTISDQNATAQPAIASITAPITFAPIGKGTTTIVLDTDKWPLKKAYTGSQVTTPEKGTDFTVTGSASTPDVYFYSANDTSHTTPIAAPINAGSYQLGILVADDENGAAGSEFYSFTIEPKVNSSLTVTVTGATPTYDGTAKKPTVTVQDGTTPLTACTKEHTHGAECTGDYYLTYSNNVSAGTDTASVTVTGVNNYAGSAGSANFSIAQATGTAAITGWAGQTFTYPAVPTDDPTVTKNGSETPVFTYYTDAACTNALAARPTDAGSYWVKASVAADDNHTAVVSDAYAFTINKGTLTGAQITGLALSYDVYYQDTAAKTVDLSAITAKLTGLAKGAKFTALTSSDADSILASSSSTASALNYQLASTAAAGKTATLTATINSGNYNDFDVTVTIKTVDLVISWPTAGSGITVKGSPVYGDTYGDILTGFDTGSVTATAGADSITGKFSVKDAAVLPNAGVTTATLVFTADAGQTISGAFEHAYTITAVAKRTLTVTPKEVSVIYGTAEQTIGYTSSGAVLGQSPVFTGTLSRAAGTDVKSYAINQGSLSMQTSGSFNADNYSMTVESGKNYTITAAAITTITTAAPGHQLNAYEARSYDSVAAFKNIANSGAALPTQVTVTWLDSDGVSRSEAISIVWNDSADAYNAKNAVYHFTGSIAGATGGVTNFQSSEKTLVATVTVTPVTAAQIQKDSATALSNFTVAKATVQGASALTDVGVPGTVYVTYDVADVPASASLAAAWDKTIAEVKAALSGVTAEQDATVTLNLQAATLPTWATPMATMPGITLTITDKYVIPDNDITRPSDINVNYLSAITLPAVGSIVSDSKYPGAAVSFTYTQNGQPIASPVNAGVYSVTATVENATYKGTVSFTLTINRIAPTANDFTVTLPNVDFDGKAHPATVAVKSGVSGMGTWTVQYNGSTAEPVNVGGYAVMLIIAQGTNYSATPVPLMLGPVIIKKASLSSVTTITGTAAVGQTLTANTIYDGSVDYQWYRNGIPVPNAIAKTYVLTEADANQQIKVNIVAKSDSNYVGSQMSAPTQVARMPISGSVTVTADNDYLINQTVRANISAVLPTNAQSGLTYVWKLNGTAIPGETGSALIIPVGSAGKQLTVEVTGNGNYIGTLTSAAVEVGKTALTGTLSIPSGGSVNSGTTLNAGSSQINGSALSASSTDYTLQWTRNGVTIPGANGLTYTTVKADCGCAIALTATGKNDYTGTLTSSNSVVVNPEAPDMPVLNGVPGDRQVRLSWQTPAANGKPITGYLLYVKEVGGSFDPTKAISIPAGATEYTVTGLTNEITYVFMMVAQNEIGSSNHSAEITVKPVNPGFPIGGNASHVIHLNQVTNGTAALSAVTAQKDKTIVITPTPDRGYAVAQVTVTDSEQQELVVTNTANGAYTFVMPDREVWVTVTLRDVRSNPFVDVAVSDWYYESVQFVSQLGLMKGMTANTFGPQISTTRGMIVTMLYRLEGSPATFSVNRFTDVSANAYYYDAVRWAAQNDIVRGMTATLYAPDTSISREQLAAILHRYAMYKGLASDSRADLSAFADVNTVSGWALEDVRWACAEQLMNGMDGTLQPTGLATRAQVAAMFMRLVNNVIR